MSFKKFIHEDYKEAIALAKDIPEELRRALKTNERVPIFFDNLEAQLRIAEARGIKLDRPMIKMMVYSLTEFFIKTVKAKADLDSKSDLQKRLDAKTLAPEFSEFLDDQGNGSIPELGIEIKEKSHESKIS